MKFLVLEQNDRLIKIYKKIFQEKKHEVEFVKTFEEFQKTEKFKDSSKYLEFDALILEKKSEFSEARTEKRKVVQPPTFDLFPYLSQDKKGTPSETREIIEKPFALVSVLAKIQLDQNNS